MVSINTRMGCTLASGGRPCASSIMVMPKDQMSADVLYLQQPPQPAMQGKAGDCG
jgi:hypothetical protein